MTRTRIAVTNVRNTYLKDNAKQFMCNSCYVSFDTNKALETHEASQHIKKYKYKCLLCSHLTYTAATMRNYLLRTHGYESDYIKINSLIPQCEKLCTSETQTQPIHHCTEGGCTFQNDSPKRLLIHKLNHSNAKYKCRPCDILCKALNY